MTRLKQRYFARQLHLVPRFWEMQVRKLIAQPKPKPTTGEGFATVLQEEYGCSEKFVRSIKLTEVSLLPGGEHGIGFEIPKQ